MKTHPLLTRSRATALVTALALAFGPGGLLPGFMVGAVSAAPVKKGGATVTLNFVNAEIEGVARAMAVIVDKQMMVDPRVKGAITLYSDQPLTPREAYLNFLAALRGQGFSVVEVGNLLKIVPEKYLLHAHHWLILHGRYVCKARKPDCPLCVIADICKSPEKTTSVPAPLVELKNAPAD